MDFPLKVDQEIELHVMSHDQVDALWTLRHDNLEYLQQRLPWVARSHSDMQAYVIRMQEAYLNGERLPLTIWLNAVLVGSIALIIRDGYSRKAEITYWLAQAHTGQGVMTRAGRALLKYGFERLRLNRIYARCATDNPRSYAVVERLGFKREGLIRQDVRLNDRYLDMYVYGLLAEDWSPARMNDSGFKPTA